MFNGENQAILVFQKDDSVNNMFRSPIRLHEQFQHVWSYKVRLFREPRPHPLSLHHEIIPEGQSSDDFSNQDFCLYDIVESVRTPESVRAM